MNFTDPQNLVLLVGVLLLASPAVFGSISLWVRKLLFQNSIKQDSQISTVVQLLELKNALDREGATVAASTAKDLVYAVIYGERPTKKD
jgi:hypothetical protein